MSSKVSPLLAESLRAPRSVPPLLVPGEGINGVKIHRLYVPAGRRFPAACHTFDAVLRLSQHSVQTAQLGSLRCHAGNVAAGTEVCMETCRDRLPILVLDILELRLKALGLLCFRSEFLVGEAYQFWPP